MNAGLRAPATAKGKEHALEQLKRRRALYADTPAFDNSTLPALSPMIFGCNGCGAEIVVPEDYIDRPKLCRECQAMKELGWLE